MRIGLGLPAAIPGVDGKVIGEWAAAAEDHGFASVGVIDRLAGGRLTAGVGLGGWPADHAAVGPSPRPAGALMDEALATMTTVWDGDEIGPAGRPRLLVGGFAPVAFERAARYGEGWVAPSFGFDACVAGIESVRAAWAAAGRAGRPRIVVERYCCLGDGGDATADWYLHHYYGDTYFDAVRADTPTTVEHLEREMRRLAGAGCDDLVLLPCDADLRRVALLADATAVASAEPGRVPA